MDISISHDMAQRALKQRNMLAIATLILSILAIIMFIAASNRDREIILQPVVPKAMAISSSGVSSEYLEAVTRDTGAACAQSVAGNLAILDGQHPRDHCAPSARTSQR